jgi:putative FmdB family regulatory protein
MPTYDFHCPKCGLDFEVQRPFSRATEPAMCPTDGAGAERVFTMPMTFVPGSAQDPASAMPDFGGHDDHGHSHGPGSHTH